MHKDNNHDHHNHDHHNHNHQNHGSHDHHHHDHSHHHHHHGDFKKLFLTSLPIGFTLSRAIGAILMSLSTVIVALNAMQLRLPKK